MDAAKSLADFLAFLKEAEERYLSAQEEERRTNDETQDILHALEFQWYDIEQSALLVYRLGTVRMNRRRAKDDMVMTGLVMTWITDNRKVIRALERLQTDVQLEEQRKKNRTYQFRTSILDDIDETGGHDNES